ncbi:hypothetical protein HZC21_01655 [Candidatus Peregrinibacteria bacterium]|nr:hypothetical protein [Candidatus Peregrinibacteria bacterium]
MPPGQPLEIPYQKPKPLPPPKSELIKEGDEAPLDKGDVQPLNPGEKAEAATERLTTVYIAKGREYIAKKQVA